MITRSRREYFLLGFVPICLLSFFYLSLSFFSFCCIFPFSAFDVSFSVPTFSPLRQTTFLLTQTHGQVHANATERVELSTAAAEIWTFLMAILRYTLEEKPTTKHHLRNRRVTDAKVSYNHLVLQGNKMSRQINLSRFSDEKAQGREGKNSAACAHLGSVSVFSTGKQTTF